MPAMIGPPDYDDLSTLRSNDSNDEYRRRLMMTSPPPPQPQEPPPPYVSSGIPPPAYDDALLDALFIDDALLQQENPLYSAEQASPQVGDHSAGGSVTSTRTLTLPSAVIAHLESVLRMNGSTPASLQSPADTLTSCATERSSHARLSNDVDIGSSCDVSGRSSLALNGGSNVRRPDRPLNDVTNHAVDPPQRRQNDERIESLRSALSAHLQALNEQALTSDSCARQQRPQRRRRHDPASTSSRANSAQQQLPGSPPPTRSNTSGHPDIRNFFNRPAVMWNRTVWSEASQSTRNNFGLNSGFGGTCNSQVT